MKSLLKKLTAAVSGAVLVALGVLMAGLGVSVVALLAMFGLAAAGLALLAAPFVQMIDPPEDHSQPTTKAAA